MTTATYDLTGPLLVSELPTTSAPRTTPGVLQTWLAERKVLRQSLAFERGLSGMEPRMRAEFLAAARRSS